MFARSFSASCDDRSSAVYEKRTDKKKKKKKNNNNKEVEWRCFAGHNVRIHTRVYAAAPCLCV